MKFIYASLAFGLVAADIFDQVDEILDQAFEETHNGFKIHLQPFFYMESQQPEYIGEGAIGYERFEINLDGQGEPFLMEVQANFHDNGVTIHENWSGVYNDLEPELLYLYNLHPLAIDYTDNYSYDRFDVEHQVDIAYSSDGVEISTSGNWSNDNGDAIQHWKGGLNIDGGLDGNQATIEIDTHLSVECEGSWSEEFVQDNTLGFQINSAISSDIQQCGEYFDLLSLNQPGSLAGAKCKVGYSMSYDCIEFGEGDIESSLTFKPAKISADVTLPNGETHTILVRGETIDIIPDILTNGNYYAIYYHEGLDTRKAFRNGDTTLVLRVPGHVTVIDILLPELERLVEPLSNFYANIQNAVDVPLLIVYFDHLALKMTNEFDYSSIIELSRLDSEYWPLLNSKAQQFLVQLNADIITTLQLPIVGEYAQVVRDYLTYLLSANGLADFEDIWGSDFGY
jgi:hypothetical protein